MAEVVRGLNQTPSYGDDAGVRQSGAGVENVHRHELQTLRDFTTATRVHCLDQNEAPWGEVLQQLVDMSPAIEHCATCF